MKKVVVATGTHTDTHTLFLEIVDQMKIQYVYIFISTRSARLDAVCFSLLIELCQAFLPFLVFVLT